MTMTLWRMEKIWIQGIILRCICKNFSTKSVLEGKTVHLEETKIQYKSFVEKYMLFNRSIAARLLYWSGIHSIHYDGVAPLNTNIPFLSKKLEYDFPEAEFNAAIKSVTREELTPSNHLATDGLAFYDALPSENARVTMQNKEFFVMKHEITLEEGDV